ncbi:hypothetical protein [Microlunatus parietis]|uniref:Heme-degrading monooxygenase HmoA n=1 Tax=Microlunatus parietis TaxID=682979 RepID=A0A7Y9IC93_9ACTN|nr:hypothetical protein [Microlunatus parietis]NYE74261.1 heme-degrading monooxygenase HmoA [Microlunatus parietis]
MPENIDPGIRFVDEEVRPMLGAIGGCRGLSVLIDRDSGECIATSSWDSEESMRASMDEVEAIRARAGEVFGGSISVDEWEIALMHREHRTSEGCCSRVTWADVEPSMPEAALQFIRDSLPKIEQLNGFCSISVLLNRDTGRCCITSTYDSREALEGSRAMADQLRAAATDAAGMAIREVREYELAMAHLHVPELV